MEIHTIRYENKDIVVLLDDDMKLVKPVYDYLKYLRQKDRAKKFAGFPFFLRKAEINLVEAIVITALI